MLDLGSFNNFVPNAQKGITKTAIKVRGLLVGLIRQSSNARAAHLLVVSGKPLNSRFKIQDSRFKIQDSRLQIKLY